MDCLLLEADDANSMKESLVTAVKLVLDMEGSNGRIQNVIQLLVDSGDIFCAVHAQIAKQIGMASALSYLASYDGLSFQLTTWD